MQATHQRSQPVPFTPALQKAATIAGTAIILFLLGFYFLNATLPSATIINGTELIVTDHA